MSKKVRFTPEQMEVLSRYDRQFTTAATARWCSYIPENGVLNILKIFEDATGAKRPFRIGCQSCVLDLIMDTAVLYFAQLQEDAEKTPVNEPAPVKAKKIPSTPRKSGKAKNSKQK